MEYFDSQFYSMEDFGKIHIDQGFIGFDNTKDLFDPTKIEDMMIEEDKTTAFDSFPDQSIQSPTPIANERENYSKQCLKFCRKISNIIPEYLLNQNEFFQEVLKFNSGILEGVANSLKLGKISLTEFTTLQTECLLKLWSSFKDIMSYSKNKKICIVKQEYWAQIFEMKASTAALKDIFAKILESPEKLEGKQLLKDSTFCEILARMLYASNKMLTLISIIRDSTDKGIYLRNLETIDNFILLLFLPEFFQYYNHRGGKFAIECCGRCKICRSKAIPADFLSKLKTAKENVKMLITRINETFSSYGSNIFGLVVCLMEYAYNEF